MKRPDVHLPLPGPRARGVLKRNARYVSGCLTRLYPIVPERGEGCWIWDFSGRLQRAQIDLPSEQNN
jgi:4-aminobutyrate aminotransferase